MRTLYLILYIVAAVCFGLAFVAGAVPPRPDGTVVVTTRVNIMALGLLAWVLVPLIQTADKLAD